MEKKEEKEEKKEAEEIPRPRQSLWSQCRERLRSGLSTSSTSSSDPNKQRTSTPPFGYFANFAKVFSTDVPLGQGKQMSDEEAQGRPLPQKHHPMLSRLFAFTVSEDLTKRAVLRRPTEFIDESATSLPTTMRDDVHEGLGRRGSTVAEESEVEDDDSSISGGPEASSSESTKKEDKIYKRRLLKHERDTKASVPLPLQEVMEEEVLAILRATLVDYKQKLGPHHPLTIEMEAAVDRLHLQICARSLI